MAGTAATSVAAIPEQDLEKHFSRPDMWGIWGNPGKWIGNPVILAGVGGSLFAISRTRENGKFRSLSYSLLQGSLMSAALIQPAKVSFRRLRPNGEDHSSFPSGHAADSFMYATVFTEHYGWKAAVPGYLVAAYVTASRLEERKHHLTDAVAGAAIGYLIGKTVTGIKQGGAVSRFALQAYPTRGGFVGSIRVAIDRSRL